MPQTACAAANRICRRQRALRPTGSAADSVRCGQPDLPQTACAAANRSRDPRNRWNEPRQECAFCPRGLLCGLRGTSDGRKAGLKTAGATTVRRDGYEFLYWLKAGFAGTSGCGRRWRAVLAGQQAERHGDKDPPSAPHDPDTGRRVKVAFASLRDRASSNLDPTTGVLGGLPVEDGAAAGGPQRVRNQSAGRAGSTRKNQTSADTETPSEQGKRRLTSATTCPAEVSESLS
jgi:hypothetical protein